MTLPFVHPFSMVIAGPSMAGKTRWVVNLIKNTNWLVTPPPNMIYWCYTEWQSLYDRLALEIDTIKFHRGLIDMDLIDQSIHNMIVLDDLMTSTSEQIADLFTKYVHHKNLSVIFIIQNLYHKSSYMRTIHLNTSYLVLFKNPRDINQIEYLARSMYSKQEKNFLQDAYKDATRLPYSYLVIDLRQDSDEITRIRTGIFPHQDTFIYLPSSMLDSFDHQLSSYIDHEQKT
jgi:hypothetical protein